MTTETTDTPQQTDAVGAQVQRGVRLHDLSPACQELLDAMRRGVKVPGMFGIGGSYFREDTMSRCTRQVGVLIRKRLAVEQQRTWRGSIVTAAMPPAA